MSEKILYRVGQIVPSSNVTMETEIPAMLKSRELITPQKFTFHSSRMRMKKVTPSELLAMDNDSIRCALELSDAKIDILAYACLVAIMSMGKGYHYVSQEKLHEATVLNHAPTAVITSAGALVDCLHIMGAKKISIITPYIKSLTNVVIEYLEAENIIVKDSISLEIADNVTVGQLNPLNLVEIVKKLNIKNADVIVLSACVQMPSLAAIKIVEDALQIPVISSATATVFQLLKKLNLQCMVPNAGRLLSGLY